eukprot:2086181-Amphidinium_carterae.1
MDIDASASSELYDQPLVENLSTKGDQPTVGALAAQGRVLTCAASRAVLCETIVIVLFLLSRWESGPSKPQLAQLHALASKAYAP